MDFTLPEHLPSLLARMDAFIEAEIAPLEARNIQYLDRRLFESGAHDIR